MVVDNLQNHSYAIADLIHKAYESLHIAFLPHGWVARVPRKIDMRCKMAEDDTVHLAACPSPFRILMADGWLMTAGGFNPFQSAASLHWLHPKESIKKCVLNNYCLILLETANQNKTQLMF